MLFLFVLAIFLFTYGSASQFRFDYEFSELADGWLKFHVIPATWDEARMRCHTEGAVLASPLTWELKAAIKGFLRKQNRTCEELVIFSGVHSTFSKGDYFSIEGVPLLRLPITWVPGEPNNYGNSESCLVMTCGGDMADVPCTLLQPYVCYKKFTQLTTTNCGTTDKEYTLDSRTGSCYKIHTNGLVWADAFMTCAGEGGYLAIINDEVEAALMREKYAKYSPLIGMRNWGLHGRNFMSIHGESLDKVYHSWANGEPNNVTHAQTGEPSQYCISIKTDARLDDNWCNYPVPFICEKDPKSLL